MSVAAFVRETSAVAEAEVRKLRRDQLELLTRSVQPILWLVVFGQVFTRVHAIPTGDRSYLDFLAPGVLAQSVLFVSIFYGIAVIWERDLGIVHKLLVSPASRGALVLGKGVSAGVRGTVQAAVIYVLCLLLGVHLRRSPIAAAGVVAAIVVGSAVFSTMSLIVACIVKTRERFMGIGQVLTMPLFFASNAIYPLDVMPAWLQTVARANPLTYLVDALRALALPGEIDAASVGLDFAVLTAVLVVVVLVAARLYPRVVD